MSHIRHGWPGKMSSLAPIPTHDELRGNPRPPKSHCSNHVASYVHDVNSRYTNLRPSRRSCRPTPSTQGARSNSRMGTDPSSETGLSARGAYLQSDDESQSLRPSHLPLSLLLFLCCVGTGSVHIHGSRICEFNKCWVCRTDG